MKVYMYPEKKAAYKGKLIQYTYHSLGRSDLSDKGQVFLFAEELAGNPGLEIITFKENEKLPDLSEMNSKRLHLEILRGSIRCQDAIWGLWEHPIR